MSGVVSRVCSGFLKSFWLVSVLRFSCFAALRLILFQVFTFRAWGFELIMSSQRLFDSQVLEMDYPLLSPLFNSQLDPSLWAEGHTLAAPVEPATVDKSRTCGLKRKDASQDLEPDFPNAFVEQRPSSTIVAIPDEKSSKKKDL